MTRPVGDPRREVVFAILHDDTCGETPAHPWTEHLPWDEPEDEPNANALADKLITALAATEAAHNHDEHMTPTFPVYRDRCPVGCDDVPDKPRLRQLMVAPNGSVYMEPARPTVSARLAAALDQHNRAHHWGIEHCSEECVPELASALADTISSAFLIDDDAKER
jgi:hypothetical protein